MLKKKLQTQFGDLTRLLLMHKPFRDTTTFCTFEKMQEPITADKRYWEQQAIFKRKEAV
jgi:hypothetical protein